MKAKPLPDLDYLNSILHYNPDDGTITCKTDRANRKLKAGDSAEVEKDGYKRVCIMGSNYRSHRLAYYMYYGVDPGENQIDHVDGCKSNNRISNLRIATISQNKMNTRVYSNNNLGIKNISLRVDREGYEFYDCRITVNGKIATKRIKSSDGDAVQKLIAWRDQKLKELHGEFARTE